MPPPMLWIGGGQGAGKSTLSWHLSREYDLPLHQVDLWTYDHRARLPAGGSLDEELAAGAESAAEAFVSSSRLRLGLVLDDIAGRDLGEVPAIVDGPQLMPEFAGRLPIGWGVWLLPDPARTLMAREARLANTEVLADRPGAARSRAELIAQRDAILTARARQGALLAGRPVIEVPPVPDWRVIAAVIRSALAPGLAAAPRLAPGRELSRQRRYENRAADRQGRLWLQDAALSVMPDYPFGCACGESRCGATWTATPEQYAAETASERRLIAHDRT
jgi:hypothetical protein